MNFEWDTVKVATNLQKHGVSFEIAARAFENELSATFPDPDHSSVETRLISGALAQDGRLLVISHTENLALSGLLALESQRVEKGNAMTPKTPSDNEDELLPEYEFDFSTAERGRYAARLKTEGSNLVLVEADLAKAFPDSASVNAALRSVVEFAQVAAGLTRRTSTRTTKRRAA